MYNYLDSDIHTALEPVLALHRMLEKGSRKTAIELEEMEKEDTTPTYELKRLESLKGLMYIKEFVLEALNEPTNQLRLIKYNELFLNYLERKSYLFGRTFIPDLNKYSIKMKEFKALVNECK